MSPGPLLEHLTRRLVQTPADLLGEPAIGSTAGVETGAVAADVLRSLGARELDTAWLAKLHPDKADKAARNHLRVMLVASWLLADAWFHGKVDARAAQGWLRDQLAELSGIASADACVKDDDRREELARLCLKAFGYRAQNESDAQAQDRLESISSVERNRVIAAARRAHEEARKQRAIEEARARKVREEMERKAAAEAAAKGTRE
jgi:hypothetical protein